MAVWRWIRQRCVDMELGMTGFRVAVLLVGSLVLACPAFAQPNGRDRGDRRYSMPPAQRPGNGQNWQGQPPQRPGGGGTLTREERQELNRDLNRANRELDQQRGGSRRR